MNNNSWAANYIESIERDIVTVIALSCIRGAQYDYGYKLNYVEIDVVIDEVFRFYEDRVRR